jgi:hypothetical protein
MSSGLYTQPQNPQPQYPQPQLPPAPSPYDVYGAPRRSGTNWALSLLLIGGGVLLLMSVLAVAGIWYAVSSVKGMLVDLGREGVVAVVEESDIPPSEKKEVVAQVDRVVAAFKAGQIGEADLDHLLTGLQDSPVMTYISFYGMKDSYLDGTDLPPADQAELELAWRRAAYGMFSGKISTDEFYDSLPYDDHFERAGQKSDDGVHEPMRKWIARMKKLADDAGVPEDPPAIDIGDETKMLVDKLLAKGQ